jgi:hypothetical protein
MVLLDFGSLRTENWELRTGNWELGTENCPPTPKDRVLKVCTIFAAFNIPEISLQ